MRWRWRRPSSRKRRYPTRHGIPPGSPARYPATLTETQEKIHEIVSAEDERVNVIPHVPGEHTWPPLPRKDSFDDVDDVQGTLGADNKHPGWR